MRLWRSGKRGFFRIVFILSFASLVSYKVALPPFIAFLGGSALSVGLVFSFGAVVRAFSRFVGGFLRDFKGDKFTLFFSLLFRVLAFLLLFFSSDLLRVFTAISLLAFSQGLEATALLSTTAVYAEGLELSGTLFGLVLTLRMLPSVFSPVFTGFVADLYGFYSVFGLGAFFSVIALICLLLSRIELEKPGMEEGCQRKMLLEYVLIALSTFFLFISVSSFIPLLTYWLTLELGFDLALVGFILSLRNVLGMFSRFYSGYIADKLGNVEELILVGIIRSISLLLLPLAGNPVQVALLVMLHGSLMAAPSRSAFIASLSSRERYGRAYGVVGFFQDLGSMVGPVVAGFLAEAAGFLAAFYFMTFSLMVYVALLLLLKKLV